MDDHKLGHAGYSLGSVFIHTYFTMVPFLINV